MGRALRAKKSPNLLNSWVWVFEEAWRKSEGSRISNARASSPGNSESRLRQTHLKKPEISSLSFTTADKLPGSNTEFFTSIKANQDLPAVSPLPKTLWLLNKISLMCVLCWSPHHYKLYFSVFPLHFQAKTELWEENAREFHVNLTYKLITVS